MTDATSAPADAVTDEFAREWVERFLAAWHSHDPAQLPALCTDDVLWRDPFIYPDGVAQGKDEVRVWLTSMFTAIPDMRFEVDGEPFVSLDRTRLAVIWRGGGRVTGRLDPPGFAPTGQHAVLPGIDVHSFRGGELAHVLTVTDLNEAGRQLGAVPPAGSRREKMVVALQRLTARRMRGKG